MNKQRGFTLIEILIAMAIFAVVSTVSISALRLSLKTEATHSQRSEQLQQLQIALAYLERDLGQSAADSLKFEGNNLAFESIQTDGLYRLSYALHDQTWVRTDSSLGANNTYHLTLLDGVEAITITPIRLDNQTKAIDVHIVHQVFGSIIKKVYLRG